MGLNERQQRTYDRLIEPGERPRYDPELGDHLRARMDAAIGDRTTAGGVWIGKGPLGDLARCEGMFAATVLDEGEPFRHTDRTAIGAILHRAIQLDVEVISRDRDDEPSAVCRAAVSKLLDETARPEFREFWDAESDAARTGMLDAAAGLLTTFRANFPPLRDLRRDFKPTAEQKIRTELAGGNVALSGVVDLALGSPEKDRATRLLLDHKTGGSNPQYAEDMRFYALIHTLRLGAPPYRVASYFVETGEWQAEDVTIDLLEHAADRAARAARLAIAIREREEPSSLTPGAWCSWCPRSSTCASSAAAP